MAPTSSPPTTTGTSWSAGRSPAISGTRSASRRATSSPCATTVWSSQAQVTARDRSTGKVILDQPVTGFTLIRVTTDLASTERQALPLLAADLAKNVTALLAEGPW